MSIRNFIKYIMKNYCPHDIFKDKEPEERCNRFMNEYGDLGCNVCWILNIEDRKDEVEE